MKSRKTGEVEFTLYSRVTLKLLSSLKIFYVSLITVLISFSLASFFSIVFWAAIFLYSYILVPAASSIMDKIWKDRNIYINVLRIQDKELHWSLQKVYNLRS